MQDQFQREINYLRVSVTDRCNLRCVYCMPEDGVEVADHTSILSYEEIIKVIKAGVKRGIRKIRLTGGEPLVRKDIIDLVRAISAIPEIDDLALTTNGILLPKMAMDLKEAGLNRVNISLDTLRSERFQQVTRIGKIGDVWAGINAAIKAGYKTIKINTVIMRGFNDDEIIDLAQMTTDLPLHLRYIEVMPIGDTQDWASKKHVSTQEIFEILNKNFAALKPAKKVEGNGPAKYYQVPGAKGTIGFIGAISNHFCKDCNRLRLTAEGMLRPCLQSPIEVDIRGVLRKGATEDELLKVFDEVVAKKPQKHTMIEDGWGDNHRKMSQIGG